MHKLKKNLKEELRQYEEKANLSSSDLPIVQMITDIIKNICKIDALEDEYEEGHSRDGRWMARGSYDDDSSYRRRRDRMGRYSRDGGYSEEGGGYSRRGSYEGGKEQMVECIEEMMEDAKSPREKDILKRCLAEMKNA